MTPSETIRKTTPVDADALRRFRCSTGVWYEDDVEHFVQHRFATLVEGGLEAWIVESSGELLAVAAHEAQIHPADPTQVITYFNVIAARVDDRESWLVGAARVSRLLRHMFAEIFAADRSPYFYVRVANDNVKMSRFLEQNGFIGGSIPSDPRYRFYTAKFTNRS